MRWIDEFFKQHKNDNWFCIGLIAVACTAVMISYPVYGIPEGYDVAQHLRFAAAYLEAIGNESLVPVWAATDNLGFGSVGIRVYPPLAAVVLAFTQLFTN